MNNSEIQALLNKRANDIKKLKERFNGGDSTKDKVVNGLIKNIRKVEAQLLEEGCELEFITSEDGTFATISDSKNAASVEVVEIVSTEEKSDNAVELEKPVSESKASTVKKTRSSKKVVPKKKLRDDDAPSKPENVKLGVTVKESVKTKINALADDNSMKVNDVVIDLLEKVFDGEKFTVEFEKKEQTKITSFNIPSSMDDALVKLNKKTGIAKTELFNRLLEEALKDFFE